MKSNVFWCNNYGKVCDRYLTMFSNYAEPEILSGVEYGQQKVHETLFKRFKTSLLKMRKFIAWVHLSIRIYSTVITKYNSHKKCDPI